MTQIRRDDIEAWSVRSESGKAVFSDRERADLYASTRRNAVIDSLVKANLLRQTLDDLAHERAAVAKLKAELAEALANTVHIHPDSDTVRRLTQENAELRARLGLS